MASLNSTITTLHLSQLAPAVRAAYRDHFTHLLQQGQIRSFVVPYSIIGPFIIPTLWLTVPHARFSITSWAVVAFVVWCDVRIILGTSSPHVAFGYAGGLVASWGLISMLGYGLWMDPQGKAARVVREMGAVAHGEADAHQGEVKNRQNREKSENGLRRRQDAARAAENGRSCEPQSEQVQYSWQSFPADGSFAKRFNWALDMTTNFRFAGWNWSIPVIPGPDVTKPLSQTPDLSTIPTVTRAGYRRRLTPSSFLISRLTNITFNYLILDCLAVLMMKDPYFILGPDNTYPIPLYLLDVPEGALQGYRQVLSLAGVLSAISAIFNVNGLFQYYVLRYVFPMRGELWQHPSTFGSFACVLDRGLAGWWGGWWHQTFRAQFVAPGAWLVEKGYAKKGQLSGALIMGLVSFAQSGLLHASGSFTSIPRTKPWRAPLFFALQAMGIILQTGISLAARQYIHSVPKLVKRVGNVLFVVVWLHFTADLFVNDIASAGIWLLEPVPFSFFRMFGYGYPGDRWWRWDWDYLPRWYSAEHWWQSGIAL